MNRYESAHEVLNDDDSERPESPKSVREGLTEEQSRGMAPNGRQATWKNKDEVEKNIKAEIRNCSDRIRASLSSSDHHEKRSKLLQPINSATKLMETAEATTKARCDTPLQQKQVRFQLRSDGEIKAETTVKSLCTVQLSKDEIRKLWWSKQERSEMKRRAHAVTANLLATAPEYRLAVEQLLLKCCDESGNKMEWEIDRAEQTDRVDPFSYDEAVRIVVNHGARGMEQTIVAALNLRTCRFYYKCGKSSIISVLEAQTMWKKLPCFSAEQHSSMIAMQLRQYSGFAAHFARILAEGDAKVASGSYGEECEDDDETAEESTTSLSSDAEDIPLHIVMGCQSEAADFEQLLI